MLLAPPIRLCSALFACINLNCRLFCVIYKYQFLLPCRFAAATHSHITDQGRHPTLVTAPAALSPSPRTCLASTRPSTVIIGQLAYANHYHSSLLSLEKRLATISVFLPAHRTNLREIHLHCSPSPFRYMHSGFLPIKYSWNFSTHK